MTDTEYDVVVVRGMALSPNSRPKCAMCGSQKNLGRIISPGLRYGVVLCPQRLRSGACGLGPELQQLGGVLGAGIADVRCLSCHETPRARGLAEP